MLTTHHAIAFLVLAVTWAAAVLAGVAYYRQREPRGFVTHLLALAQTLIVAQVGLGLLLLSEHHRSPHRLHYLYGSLSLAAVLAPWLYAPVDRRARLGWFAGATLVAGALAVRAYMTGA
jgi:ABC-type proline/glycine betaine transport system permease subunit